MKNQKRSRLSLGIAQGFTLIELVFVMAIIAILAMLAIPSITDRIVKKQIIEALPLADIAKIPVNAAWALQLGWPADNAAAGLPAADKMVSTLVRAVTLENGAIHITFGNSASGSLKNKVLTLRPAVVPNEPRVPIAWICGQAAPPNKMVLQGQDRTDIAMNLLPIRCLAPPNK